jgi:hypothetical protein
VGTVQAEKRQEGRGKGEQERRTREKEASGGRHDEAMKLAQVVIVDD